MPGLSIGPSLVTAGPVCWAVVRNTRTPPNYLSIGANATETIIFASKREDVFRPVLGSSARFYNTITFYDGATLVASYTGAEYQSAALRTAIRVRFVSNG